MTAARPAPASAAPPPPRWHLRLLGDVVLADARGTAHRLPGRTATALLARLALAPDRAHPREELVDLLWPGVALDVGRNRLRQLLSTLKPLLDAADAGHGAAAADLPVLQAERPWLRLRPGAVVCDALRFEQAWRAGALQDAAALYRGELLPGFYDEWVVDERRRLAALAERLPPALPASAAPDRGAALPQAAVAAPAALNLPHYLTPVFGADHNRQQLRLAVQAHRLVTLLGPGGHGKTRLAVDLARELAQPGGAGAAFDLVAFVPLVACQGDQARPDAVLDAILLALHQDARDGEPLASLRRVVGHRRALLVLDNFEQLVEPCGALVADLLAHGPGLHLLVTSRRVLGMDGEHLHALPPLPLPPPGAPTDAASAPALARNPAVALFIDRARAVRPDLPLAGPHLAAVCDLVRHLQGMPLAIELAAARARSLDAATLLDLLRAGVPGGGPGALPEGAPALALLARQGPRGAADPRHASMLAVVQWSWDLLSPAAQRLLPQLACLPGSFTLAQAQALADAPATDTALALDELVAQSMLRSTDDGRRYGLFELIREFAASRLDATDARRLRARHRRWLTAWFQALPPSAPVQAVRDELPHLAAALCGAALDGAAAEGAALAAVSQTAMSTVSLPPPALTALQQCIEQLDAPLDRAVGLAGLARSLLVNGQAQQAAALADAALALLPAAVRATAGGGLQRAQVLARVAHVRWRLQRDPMAVAWLDEALVLAREGGALALQATILTNQGAVLRGRDPAASTVLQRQAIALWAEAGDRHGVNVGRCNLAVALLGQRAGCAEALGLLRDAIDDTQAAGDHLQHALACNLRGEACSRLGDWPAAAAAYRACIAGAWSVAEPWPLAYGLWNLPRPLAHLRQGSDAARLMGFAEVHVPTVTGPLTRADRHDLRRLNRLCAVQLPGDALARRWDEGRALALAQAVGLALQGG